MLPAVTRLPSAVKGFDGESGWGIRVRMFEISTCGTTDTDQDCIDGYGDQFGTAPEIKPALHFEIDLMHQGHRERFTDRGEDSFDIPYDAVALDEAQPHLDGLLP